MVVLQRVISLYFAKALPAEHVSIKEMQCFGRVIAGRRDNSLGVCLDTVSCVYEQNGYMPTLQVSVESVHRLYLGCSF